MLFDIDRLRPVPRCMQIPLPYALLSFLVTAQVFAQIETRSPPAFTFDWPVPGTVNVAESAVKDGKQARTTYTLVVTRSPEDGSLRIDYEDFEFVEIEGLDLSDPAVLQALAPTLALGAAIPTIVVSPDGEYFGVTDLDGMIEDSVSILKAIDSETVDDERVEQVRGFLKAPQVMEALQTKIGDYWNTWVGYWIAWDIPPSEASESEGVIPMGDVEVPCRIIREHLGVDPEDGTQVRLRMQSLVEGDEAGRTLVEAVGGLFGHMAEDVPLDDIGYVDAAMTTTFTVTTDPRTLKPVAALFDKKVILTEKGGTQRTSEDRREYTFTWTE